MRYIATAATVFAGLGLGLAGCQDDGVPPDAQFGMQVRYLTDDGVSSEVPADIYDHFIRVCVAPPDVDCNGTSDRVVSNFHDIGNPDGTRCFPPQSGPCGLFDPAKDVDPTTPGPDRAMTDLEYDTPLTLTITVVPPLPDPDPLHPRQPDVGHAPLYSSRTDGIVLKKGERRFVKVTLYPVGTFSTLDPTVTLQPEEFGRFGASLTALPDGRFLIAGGFDTASFMDRSVTDNCRALIPAIADDAICFHLVASKKAYIFEPGSGRVYELGQELGVVITGVGIGRAMHTATAFPPTPAFPEGGVLLAGGVDDAILTFTPLASGTGYTPVISPVASTPGTTVGQLPTYEIFDPNLYAVADDPDRDGNLERGGFQTPGALVAPRLFSVAALWPQSDPAAVVVLGGLNPPPPATAQPAVRWEIWNQGGSGQFLAGAGSFTKARVGAGIGLMRYASPELWIIGGVASPSNDTDLVAVWANDSTTTGTPLPPGTSHADKNFLTPCVTPLGSADMPTALLVTGSYGPTCNFVEPAWEPTYTPDATARVCPPEQIEPYIINRPTTGLTLDRIRDWDLAADSSHVMGACVTLGGGVTTNGSALVVGGASNLDFEATPQSHRIDWAATTPPTASKATGMPAYPAPAIGPSAAVTLGGDAVFFGGFNVTLAPTPPATPSITLASDIVYYNVE